jgi:hypothetical protein
MKLAAVYSDWRIVTGLALLFIGAGNCVVGLRGTERYSRKVSAVTEADPQAKSGSFGELDSGADVMVLRPLSAEQTRLSYAQARMDFYHAAFLTGEAAAFLGLALTLAGFLALVQSDIRRALRRVSAGPPRPPASS